MVDWPNAIPSDARSNTRLQHRHRTTRLGCEEIQQHSLADPLAEYCSTPLIRSVSVKYMLRDSRPIMLIFDTDAPLIGAQHHHFGTPIPSVGRPPIIKPAWHYLRLTSEIGHARRKNRCRLRAVISIALVQKIHQASHRPQKDFS